MRKSHAVFVAAVLLSGMAHASDFSIKFTLEQQNYAMSDLKDLQTSISSAFMNNGIPLRPVHRFPDDRIVSAHLLRNSAIGRIGLSYGYASTGGRVHYADRSGEFAIDQIISNHAIGLDLDLLLARKGVGLFLYVRPTLVFSHVDHREMISIRDPIIQNEDRTSLSLKENRFAFEPGLILQLPLPHLFVEFHVGYLISPLITFGPFADSRRTIFFTATHLRKSLRLDWSGLRAGVSVGLPGM
jgi:hypothetical protein